MNSMGVLFLLVPSGVIALILSLWLSIDFQEIFSKVYTFVIILSAIFLLAKENKEMEKSNYKEWKNNLKK